MDTSQAKALSGSVLPGLVVCKVQRDSLFALYVQTSQSARLSMYEERHGQLRLLGAVILDNPESDEDPVNLTVSGGRRGGWCGWAPWKAASARVHLRKDACGGQVWALEVWPTGRPGLLRVVQPDGTVQVLP